MNDIHLEELIEGLGALFLNSVVLLSDALDLPVKLVKVYKRFLMGRIDKIFAEISSIRCE